MCHNGTQGSSGSHKTLKAVGLLGLRVALGIIFVYTGYNKLGPGHAMTVGMMAKFIGPMSAGSFWAYLVGALEFVGGLMLICGVYARYAALWLAVILVVAMATVHRGGPFMGYFLPLSMLGGVIGVMGVGAGKWRLGQCECHCKMCSGKGQMTGGCCSQDEKAEKAETMTK